MKTKKSWGIIFSLVVLNCITLAYFLTNPLGDTKEVSNTVQVGNAEEETVANIGEEIITRQEWLSELEKRYGQQTLEDMIDEEVVSQMAEQYNIKIANDVIDREVKMIKTMYNPIDHQNMDEEQWKEQIEISLLLEELLTKDAVISEEEIQHYFEQNKDFYNLPTTYHLSHIIVKSEEDAKQVIKELENGSNFSTLAMEKSLDEFTANQGGDLGYVSTESDFVPGLYIEAAKDLDINNWSLPIKIEEGYGIIFLDEVIEGVSYSYDEVKDQIKRQIALDQMSGSLSVKPFWEELGVSWFYGR